jgi:hypothetical protein
MTAATDPAPYDGNALAGPLLEVFGVEMTATLAPCRACGTSWTITELSVYGPAPGLVARCPRCSSVLLRIVNAPEAAYVDLRGVSVLQIPAVPPNHDKDDQHPS